MDGADDMTGKVKPYTLNPAAGQALLNYQNRIRAAQMPLYEADCLERVGDDKGAADNHLLQGDCLSACAWLRANDTEVDLVYIDPPFASGADYARKVHLRGNGKKQVNGSQSLGEEVMYGDIWKKEDYLNWLYERLLAIREVMSAKASIYVHLDWHIGHYAKILLDEVFGEDNFINEIIWNYRGTTNTSRYFARKHDVIYSYAKSDEYQFNADAVRTPYDEGSKFHKDENGKLYKQWTKDKRHYPPQEMVDGEYRLLGKYQYDVWNDIPSMATAHGRDMTGYPTQKPEALLERIIKASSDEGMLVADFFCGSGTTAKVAHDLGRRFVASDVGQHALQTTRDRLAGAGAHFDVLKVRDGVRLFRNPVQTREKIFALLAGWQDKGEAELGEFWDGSYAKGGLRVPVKYVGLDKKLTMDLVGAVLEYAGQADAGEVLVLYAHRAAKVTQAAVNREAANHRHSDTRITLRSLDELLESRAGQLVVEDSAELQVGRVKDGWQVAIEKYYSPYMAGRVREHNQRAGLGDNPITISAQGLECVDCVQFGTLSKKGVWKGRRALEFHATDAEAVPDSYEVPGAVSHIRIRNIAGDELTMALADDAADGGGG